MRVESRSVDSKFCNARALIVAWLPWCIFACLVAPEQGCTLVWLVLFLKMLSYLVGVSEHVAANHFPPCLRFADRVQLRLLREVQVKQF